MLTNIIKNNILNWKLKHDNVKSIIFVCGYIKRK